MKCRVSKNETIPEDNNGNCIKQTQTYGIGLRTWLNAYRSRNKYVIFFCFWNLFFWLVEDWLESARFFFVHYICDLQICHFAKCGTKRKMAGFNFQLQKWVQSFQTFIGVHWIFSKKLKSQFIECIRSPDWLGIRSMANVFVFSIGIIAIIIGCSLQLDWHKS